MKQDVETELFSRPTPVWETDERTYLLHQTKITALDLIQLTITDRRVMYVSQLKLFYLYMRSKLCTRSLETILQMNLLISVHPIAGNLTKLCYHTHSLTAALDQLRVVASSTSNDPGPQSRQHQQIGQCLLPDSQFPRGRPGGRFQSAAGGVPVWASIDSCSACEAGVFSGRRQM